MAKKTQTNRKAPAKTTASVKKATVKKATVKKATVKKATVKKKTTSKAATPVSLSTEPPEPTVALPLTETQLRRAKSGLSRTDLQAYRRLLLTKRAEMLGDVEALGTDARTDSGDHFSPEHMADVGSINFEQELNLGLIESEQRMLCEIDEAIMRIDARTYGVCIETGQPIGKPRLDAKPWAKYCIEVVREKERTGKL